jgi:hypothetical protein
MDSLRSAHIVFSLPFFVSGDVTGSGAGDCKQNQIPINANNRIQQNQEKMSTHFWTLDD